MKVPLPRTLHGRILVAIILLQLTIGAAFAGMMLVHAVETQLALRQALTAKMIDLAAPMVEHFLAKKERSELQRYLKEMLNDQPFTGVVVKDRGGRTVFQQGAPDGPPHLLAAWVDAAALQSQVSAELTYDNRSLGIMTVYLSNAALNEGVAGLLRYVAYVSLLVLVVNLALMELVVRYLMAPLRPLTEMAREVTLGQWGRLRRIRGASDEVRQLTHAFARSARIMRSQNRDLDRTRLQLQSNETRLRDLVNNMQEVLVELDEDGVVRFLNPVWEQLTGYSVQESLGLPFATFLADSAQQTAFSPGRLEHVAQHDLRLELSDRDGQPVHLLMNAVRQYDAADRFTGMICTLADISENLRLRQLTYEHERNIDRLSTTDPLTGVYNRAYFDLQLARQLNLAVERGREMALMIVDLDGFQFINDTYGYAAGDQVLKTVAHTLNFSKPGDGMVARLASDEFALILPNLGRAEVEAAALRVHAEIGGIALEQAGGLQIQASIGVAIAPLHASDAPDLVRAADLALYHAKKSGRNRVDILAPEVGEAIRDLFSQGFELRRALAGGLIAPFFQPIVDLGTGEVYAYEVLTRLKRGGEYVAADEFVMLAEDLGLIREMDLFVIRNALAHGPRGARLFVNISLNSFQNPEFGVQLRALLSSEEARGRMLTLEFTERQTAVMTEELAALFEDIRAGGCAIALDDFGVGYSSYDYLRRLRPDFVKIDGSFIQGMLKNPLDEQIVRHITELSVSFGAKTVAEHVESEEIRAKLVLLGIDLGQGYLFGRPADLSGLAKAMVGAP